MFSLMRKILISLLLEQINFGDAIRKNVLQAKQKLLNEISITAEGEAMNATTTMLEGKRKKRGWWKGRENVAKFKGLIKYSFLVRRDASALMAARFLFRVWRPLMFNSLLLPSPLSPLQSHVTFEWRYYALSTVEERSESGIFHIINRP